MVASDESILEPVPAKGALATLPGSGLPDARAMCFAELEALVRELGQPSYRAKQIFRWLHLRGARSWAEMTDLSNALREELTKSVGIASLEIARLERARDGTRKYAFRTGRGDVVESVFIPDASSDGRNTLCISSQVGCAIDCKFCLTASLGLLRNLTAGEIVEQVTRVKEDLARDAALGGGRPSDERDEGRALPFEDDDEDDPVEPEPINNIVLMGMGEPLQNYGALVEALKILTSPDAHKISPRRITVSTAGIAPRIPRLGHDVKVNLAVSLNATTDEVRDQLMPINKRWNIAELMDACRAFPLPERRRITFEYVLLAGVNDSEDDARRLVRLVRRLRCKVNLIPFNEHPYSTHRRPSREVVARFQRILADGGLMVFVRTPRGDDISAACGQLGVEVDGPRKRLPVLTVSRPE